MHAENSVCKSNSNGVSARADTWRLYEEQKSH